MDLFKLLGTIAIDNSGANKALDETSSKAKGVSKDLGDTSESGEKSGGKFSNAMAKMGTAAVKVGKAVGAGMIAAGTAVTGLVTKSVSAYAQYEQLVGGVETLFKDSAGIIMQYADEAYRTAGLSANAYMETVTSFSASLLQSLGGDTAKAAEYANRAVTDMSDNANKMGTDISMIQNAYQGFAKQNYTMLDNLKLGYGGTKEEMSRLIKEASAMKDVQEELGITVDANSMSFGNIVNAISVVQKNMGIMGTTAAEASETISGSIGMMKASWENLMTAMSNKDADFGSYINKFVDSVVTVGNNLLPVVETALGGVVRLIDQLAPVIIGKIPDLFGQLLPSIVSAATNMINALVSVFPGIVSSIASILPDLVNGFQNVINALVMAFPGIIQALLDVLPTLIPSIASGLTSVFVTLCTMLPQIIQPFLDQIPLLSASLVEALLNTLPAILTGITMMIQELINMLPQVLPTIIAAIMQIITLIIDQLPVILPQLVNAIITIVNLLGEQLPVIIPMLVQALIQIITMLTEQIPILLPMLIEACIQIITAIVENLPMIIQTLIEALPAVLQSVWDAIVMFFQNLPEWFGQLFDGIVSIIGSVFPGAGEHIRVVWEAIKTNISNAVNGIWNIITTVWNSIKNVISTVINSIKTVISTVWESIKTIIANVMNIIFSVFEGDWGSIKTSITNIINAIWNVIKSVFTGIWNTIKSVITGIRDNISAVFNSVKTYISGVFNGIKSVATSVWNGIQTAMTKPIEKARDLIKGIVDKIKGFFTGMKLEFPNIKMPHFGISPSGWKIGDLLKGTIPKLSIKWYAEAMKNPMIMTKPTIFGYDGSTGQLMGGGEAGSEVVSGTATLMQMIQSSVAAQNDTLAYYLEKVIEMLAEYFPEALTAMNKPNTFVPEEMAHALAVPMNYELGVLSAQKGRGR